jgi:predicted RNA-binding protein with PIN domain
MALVRILVDGFSLLHAWQKLAPGRARHSRLAREELVKAITRYSDACGTAVTIIFDGRNPRLGAAPEPTPKNVEVLYTRTGQTADAVIERVTHLLRPYGEVLVVSNDNAERDLVLGLGGMASSCENFVRMLELELGEESHQLKMHNLRERSRYRRGVD